MIDHKRGASFTATIEIADANGNPVEITGAEVLSAIASGVARHELTCLILNGPLGLVQITATAAQTAGWPLGEYVWDIVRVRDDGHAEPWPVDSNFRLRIIDSPTLRSSP